VSFFRLWLPIIIVLGGVIVIILEPNMVGLEGAAGIIGAGLAVWLFNWLYRVGVAGETERDEEEAARDFFDRHGVWPDQVPPGTSLDEPARSAPAPRAGPHRRR
jgi:hypothetical protein